MWDGPHWMLEFGYNGVFAGDGIIDWQTRTLYLFPSLAYRVRRLLFWLWNIRYLWNRKRRVLR